MATITTTIRYASNLAELTRNLKEGRDQIETTTAAANRMVAALSGDKLIRAAHNTVAAINEIGNVARLTTQEQEKHLRTLDKAIEKMERMGQVVPTAMRQTRDALQDATAAAEKKVGMLERLDTSLGKVGLSLRGLSLAGLVGGLTAGAREAFAFAGQLTDLRDSTGLTTQELQKLNFAGKQAGLGLDQVASSVTRLQHEIASGEKDTFLKEIGVDVARIRQLSPGEMFEELSAKISALPNHTQRVHAAMELLGRTGADLLPLLTQNVDDLANGVVLMSDRTIENLDRVSDAWDALKTNTVSALGEMMGSIADFWAFVESRGPTGIAKGFMETWRAGLMHGPAGALAAMIGTFQAEEQAKQLLADAGQPAVPPVKPPTAGPTRPSAATQELQRLVDQLTGRDLAAQVRQLETAVTRAGGAAAIASDQKAKLGAQLAKLYDEGARLTPQLHGILAEYNQQRLAATDLHVTTKELASVVSSLGEAYRLVPPDPLPNLNKLVVSASNASKALSQIPGWLRALREPPAVGAWASFFSQLGPTVLAALTGGGNVGRSIGALAGQTLGTHLASRLGDTLSEQGERIAGPLSKALGSKLGGLIGSIIPGLGSIVGSLAGSAIGWLGNKFFGTAGRDLVTQFADQMGGFDALRAKLEPLGQQGEDLWRKLTQGVGRNNPEEAKRVIDIVRGALERFDEQQREAAERAAEWSRTVQDQFAKLLDATGVFGDVAPKQLQPLIAELLEMNGLTAEQKRLLEDLSGDPSLDALREAADRLGVSFHHMGAEFKQAEVSDTALQMVRDLDLLAESGANMDGVLTDAKGKINDLVHTAMNAGLQLPETLKPYIQRLIDLELLTDPSGELVRNIDQLSFTHIEDRVLNDIKSILEEIRDLLRDGIPSAARDAQGALDDLHVPDIPVPDFGDPTFNPGGYDFTDYPGVPNMASGGYVPARPGGTLVRLAEAGRGEWVIPEGDPRAPRTGEAGVNVTLNISAMDGASVQRVVEGREFAEALDRAVSRNTFGVRSTIQRAV